MHVALPGDAWAELIEVDDLRDGDRKAVLGAVDIPMAEGGDINVAVMDRMYDALLVRVVKNWSLPMPLPSMLPASLDQLTLKQARALRQGAQPHYSAVMGVEEEDPTEGSAS